MGDYEWIEKRQDSGSFDFFNCSYDLWMLLEKADKFVSESDGGWSGYNISRESLLKTGFVIDHSPGNFSIPSHEAATKLSSDAIREVWEDIVEWFEDFDGERGLKSDKAIKTKLAEGLRWGFWRQARGGYCGLDGIGENGFTVQSYASKEDGIPVWGTRHGYNKEEIPKVSFKLWAFEQTGLRYFVGAGSFCEIDAVSRVPSYPSNITDQQWGERTLKPNEDGEDFQRPLSLVRQQEISAFVDEDGNRILNSIMAYLTETAVREGKANLVHVSDDEWRLDIDLASFLVPGEQGLMWDHDNGRDLRPILLQDGQHRVRGGAISAMGQHKRVPLVVLPPEMSLSDAARTFTEINTGSEELKPLQKLHLRHRFKLSSMKKELDFRDYRTMDEGNHRRRVCRSNRLAYEITALLCADPDSAIAGRIRMMDVGSGASPVCNKADKFTKIAAGWFSKGSVFDEEVK